MDHLDWNARMRIIMGTAYCLQYMHHELNPPVAHSNLSSHCIYLTDDYAAKVRHLGTSSKNLTGFLTTLIISIMYKPPVSLAFPGCRDLFHYDCFTQVKGLRWHREFCITSSCWSRNQYIQLWYIDARNHFWKASLLRRKRVVHWEMGKFTFAGEVMLALWIYCCTFFSF